MREKKTPKTELTNANKRAKRVSRVVYAMFKVASGTQMERA